MGSLRRRATLISTQRLTKRLGTVKAVSDIDLTIAEGEKLAILGPNGAGKSTLLRLIAGLLRPTYGSVNFDGREPRLVRESIGYLGHDPYLYGYLTATENLEFFADLYGVPRHLAGVGLEKVRMAHKAGTRANELSQGETQRVALARALLHNPRHLLLDEPFSNLDVETAGLVQSLIQEPGRTVLLVTHDRRRAEFCDRSIRLEHGRVSDPAGAPIQKQPGADVRQ